MQNLVFSGKIITSNKNLENSATKRKLAYITNVSESVLKKLKDIKTVYENKNGQKYLIIKLSPNVWLYEGEYGESKKMECSTETPNFEIENCNINILFEDFKKKNQIVRITDIQVENFDDVKVIKPISPFRKS